MNFKKLMSISIGMGKNLFFLSSVILNNTTVILKFSLLRPSFLQIFTFFELWDNLNEFFKGSDGTLKILVPQRT
jgi:hypothetical protein